MNRFFIIFVLLFSGQLFAQNQEGMPFVRSITIENNLNKYCFSVLVENVDIKTFPKVFYYWFSDGKINQNMDGYSGLLLNGKYQVFTKAGQLIEQGTFENGVKEGIWNYWNSTGEKIRTIAYDKGQKNGKDILYHSENESEITPYKKGVIHGNKIIYKQDTCITIRFRNGEEVKKDKNIFKKGWRIFGKKKTEKTDGLSDKEIRKEED